MQLFYCPLVINNSSYLCSEESNHCVKVLRKKLGDIINLIDGCGNFYEARITISSVNKVVFEVLRTWQDPPRPYSLHIAIAPTKNNDRFEWFLEIRIPIKT